MIDQPLFVYARAQLAVCLQNTPPALAKVVGNVVVTILRLKDFSAWPDILKLIGSLLQAKSPAVVENAIFCLEKICEDIELVYRLQRQDFESLIPQLIAVAKCKELSDQARGSAIHSLAFSFASMGSTAFAPYMPQTVEMMLQAMQESMFEVNGRSRRAVNKNLCGVAILLLKDRREQVLPILPALFAFHIRELGSAEYDVAFAACDFWHVYLRTEWEVESEPKRWEALDHALPELVPQVLSAMKYSTTDLAGVIRDSAADIKYTESSDMLKPDEDEDSKETEGNL